MMSKKNIKIGIVVWVIIAVLVGIVMVYVQRSSETVEVTSPNDRIIELDPSSAGITNFEQCVAAGNPVMESYPRQCTTIDGKNFREDIENDVCIVTGCSGQVCASQQVDTTCEYKEEYACYTDALCELQEDGICGWTMTNELGACLEKAIMDGQPIFMKDIEAVSTVETEQEEQEQKEQASELKIKNALISWGHQSASNRTIDTIIVHSSYNSLGGDEYDVEKIIDIYKQYEVGAHYIIDRKGTVHQLVKEKDIAYHAGVSSLPDGRTGVNQISIGIEIVNNKEDEMTDDQYEAINALIEDIQDRYDIKYVLGHDDIAPERKTDPWNIEWDKIDR